MQQVTLPEIPTDPHRTCGLCHLVNIPCAKIGRTWTCYFCLTQAVNQVVNEVRSK